MAPKAPIIGVMGGGTATPDAARSAQALGERIAEQGWILLNGGRNAGIMEASAKGARSRGGLTVGVLPDETSVQTSDYIDIPILTGMGSARNVVNVLSSRVVVACPGGAGTASEVALAVKYRKPVILLGFDAGTLFEEAERQGMLFRETEVEGVVARIRELLGLDQFLEREKSW